MNEFYPVYIYFGLVAFVMFVVLAVSALFRPYRHVEAKYLPYESGIKTTTFLLSQRFLLRHYLVALMFLVFDVEVVFLYPWAVIAKTMGSFAFIEISIFLVAMLIAFGYIWTKGGLQWE